jgi:serine/threonine-protein kinase
MSASPILRPPYRELGKASTENGIVRMLASDERTKGLVSVKAYALRGDLALEKHYRRQAETLQRMAHSHLQATLDYWEDDDYFFLVQEHLEGEDLETHLARVRALRPRDQISHLLIQLLGVAWAVEALHRAGLALGRLTMEEVFIEPSGNSKLIYESLSPEEKSLSRLRKKEALQSTVASLSPEELQGAESDVLTDIYSFGSILYQVFAGRCPLAGITYEDVANGAGHLTIEPPSDFNVDVSPALDRVILSAVERDRNKRTRTAKELSRQIYHLLNSPMELFANRPRTESLIAKPTRRLLRT